MIAGFNNKESYSRPPRLLVLANLLGRGGGTVKALQSIDYYHRIGYQLTTFLDYLSYVWSVEEGFNDVMAIYRRYNIVPIGYEKPVSLVRIVKLSPKSRRRLYSNVGELLYYHGLSKKVFLAKSYKPDVIISFHEDFPYLRLAYELKAMLSAPVISFLQSPPFYEKNSRMRNIEKTCRLHRIMLSASSWHDSISVYLKGLLGNIRREDRREIEALLKSLDMVITISKAVAVEMGRTPNNLVCMDPGVTLDDNALNLIIKTRALNISRGDYVAFVGRPIDCRKGFIEALIAFKYLSREFPTLRLFVAGTVSSEFKRRVYRFLKEFLSIDESRVVFTGFLNREDLYRLIRGARLVLYPSHADAFPFTVLESLMLETPVVAYRIPALEIYYGDVEKRGIWLVNEGDIGGLAKAAIEVLELEKKNLEVKHPRIRSWNDIMKEEVELISRVLR